MNRIGRHTQSTERVDEMLGDSVHDVGSPTRETDHPRARPSGAWTGEHITAMGRDDQRAGVAQSG